VDSCPWPGPPARAAHRAGADGRQDQLAKAVVEFAAVQGCELALQDPADHTVEGVLGGIWFGGDPGINDGQDVAGVDLLQGRLHALRLAGLVIVDLIEGWNGDGSCPKCELIGWVTPLIYWLATQH
jgi:hypothetical protein